MGKGARFDELRAAARDGRLLKATREQLQDYAMLVCDAGAGNHLKGHEWPELADTVRLMLLVRISEETQTKALTVSIVALVIAIAAFAAAAVQAWVALRSSGLI